LLSGTQITIFMDAGVYPIARWGVERAAARGAPVKSFPHHDVSALRRLIQQDRRQRRAPLVVTDGFCPGCGRTAPLGTYLEIVRARGGRLVLDDTQALGLLGHSPGAGSPYGQGGGGSLRWCGASGPEIITVSSLAKSFGVPIAVLAGDTEVVRRFEDLSETRVHCSPPSIAAIRATENALAMNEHRGDHMRARLAGTVQYFRHRLASIGLSAAGGLFPMQTLAPLSRMDATMLHARLHERGMQTVLHRRRGGSGTRLSLILTALHRRDDIDRATEALAMVTGRMTPLRRQGGHHERLAR
jgi:8-amino-7-oxononanoate synthase